MSNVKVVYYKRAAASQVHIHAGEYAQCFYVPSEQTMLYMVQHGTFGGDDVLHTTEKHMLAEAEEIMVGRLPQVDGVTFSDMKELEFDQYTITSLLDDARAKKALDERVRTGFEKLKELVSG